MNAAARVVSGTKKYDRGLTHLLYSELHWLDVADRVTYKLRVTVYKCLHGQAPDYLSELCIPVAQVAERQHLRSASLHLLVVPRFQLDTRGIQKVLSLTQLTTEYAHVILSLFNIVPSHRNALGPAFLQSLDPIVEEFLILVL